MFLQQQDVWSVVGDNILQNWATLAEAMHIERYDRKSSAFTGQRRHHRQREILFVLPRLFFSTCIWATTDTGLTISGLLLLGDVAALGASAVDRRSTRRRLSSFCGTSDGLKYHSEIRTDYIHRRRYRDEMPSDRHHCLHRVFVSVAPRNMRLRAATTQTLPRIQSCNRCFHYRHKR